MTKRELVNIIAEETDLTQQQVYLVIQKTLDAITESMVKGNTVEFRDFGVFEVKTRKARLGRNPNKPENTVPIPPRRIVKFKPGKAMKIKVLNLP
jgi:nucleoid DNA-binding protein